MSLAARQLEAFGLDALELREPEHRYILGGLLELPGVTGSMRRLGLGFQGNAPQSALDRGNYVHAASEIEDEGDLDWSAIPTPYLGYMEAYRAARASLGVRNVVREWPAFHRQYGYAGKCDGIVVDRRGRLAVLELKSGASEDWAVQAAAYRELRQHWVPQGKITYGILLKVNVDGTFRIEEDSLDEAWRTWVACLQILHWQRNGRRT